MRTWTSGLAEVADSEPVSSLAFIGHALCKNTCCGRTFNLTFKLLRGQDKSNRHCDTILPTSSECAAMRTSASWKPRQQKPPSDVQHRRFEKLQNGING